MKAIQLLRGAATAMGLVLAVCSFTFSGCKKPTCEKICQNGGTLDEEACECECTFGYEGGECEMEKAVEKMALVGVKVIKFPQFKPGGDVWDDILNPNLTPPDLMVRLESYTGQRLEVTKVKSNGNSANTYELEIRADLSRGIESPESIHRLYLIDYDEMVNNPVDPDYPGKGDQMDRIDFTPYQEGRGFPTKKVLKGSKATIELTFEYVLEDEG